MNKMSLILSVFPGLDLLGMGFEMEGFCVVRGGDPLLGQLGVEDFHPPSGVFTGVIGGPPCGMWAKTRNLAGGKARQPNLLFGVYRLRMVKSARYVCS